MKKSVYLFVALSALIFVGCNRLEPDIAEIDGEEIALKADFADGDATKAVINNNYQFEWAEYDELAVDTNNGSKYELRKFSLKTGAGTKNGTFIGAVRSGYNQTGTAIYPYKVAKYSADNKVQISIPSTVDALDSDLLSPMIARYSGKLSTSTVLPFKFLGGIVEVSVNNVPAAATKLVFTAPGMKISGDFNIVEEKGEMVYKAETVEANSPLSSITFNLPYSVKEQNVNFHVPLPVGAFQKYNVTLLDKDNKTLGKIEGGANNKNSIERGALLTMPTLNAGGGSLKKNANFTVMMYATGGTTLDDCISRTICQAMSTPPEEMRDVNMTVQFKLSKKYQEDSRNVNFKGIRRFALRSITGISQAEAAKIKDSEFDNENGMFSFLNKLTPTTEVKSPSVDMRTPETLQDFINWSVENYPAENYILILSSHGSGWNANADGKKDGATKAIISDDAFTSGEDLSINDVTNAIKGSKLPNHRVSMIYTDACLMASLEVMKAYSECADFMLASMELAPGYSISYYYLMHYLGQSAQYGTSLYSQMTSLVKEITDKGGYWETANIHSDLGLYDLTSIDKLLAIVKEFAVQMSDKFPQTGNIAPGTSWHSLLTEALMSCTAACEGSVKRKDLTPFEAGGVSGLTLFDFMDDTIINKGDSRDLDEVSTNNLQLWFGDKHKGFKPGYGDTLDTFPFDDKWCSELKFCMRYSSDCCLYSMADLMRRIAILTTEKGIADKTFSDLHDRYIATLKDIAVIGSTSNFSQIPDFAYEITSPSINILPLNIHLMCQLPNDWTIDDYDKYEWGHYLGHLIKQPSVSDYTSWYKATEFDKATGWSAFLTKMDCVPSPQTNLSPTAVIK